MTTFVVSMFLPVTVDFNELSEYERRANPEPAAVVEELEQQASDTKSVRPPGPTRQASLFQQTTAPTPPKTPAVEHVDFFAVNPSAATHFAKPTDPRTLVRSDSHVPEWGNNGPYFNQPSSKARPPPPDTILEYANSKERTDNVRKERLSLPQRHSSRDHSRDPRWVADWSVVPAVQGNGGLTNAVRASRDAGSVNEVLNVGLVGFPTDVLGDKKKEEIESKLEAEHECLTVFVSDTDLDGHYSHYCKTILWPVFHYQIPDHPKSKAYEDHSYQFYVNLNQAFADKVVANYKRGDTIWIHDYHLCLVPAMVRKKLPDAQIGFFLHAAFPSSEVFRCLAARKNLLEGMLGANLVAFQTHEYAHHFLQTCSRILSVEATEDGVQLENNFVNVWSIAIGIDPVRLSLERDEQPVLEWIEALRNRYPGKKLIVARDKLDGIRGVRQKLLAFELFLNKYPDWRDKVVLIQVATPTTENDDLAATVSEIVTRIDAVHSSLSHNPLVYLRQDIAFTQYLALLSMADILMVTSLRDGMNLGVHEFAICQDGKHSGKKHGPVILSEFTGSAAFFEGAELSVNPWDYKGCAETIKVALDMSDEEKATRFERIRNKVLNHTGDFWFTQLANHLTKVHDEHFRRDTMSIPRLSNVKLGQAYQKCDKRLFLLDYEGTLAPFGSVNNTIITNLERATETLNDLLQDNKNMVYVMSGRTMKELQMVFARVPGVGLIAENGCYVRPLNSDEWIAFADEEKANKWKDSVKSILQYYRERVEGSWVEERNCSLIFHYENTPETDSANRQAGDCATHINDACESLRVRAVPTKDSVIIEPMDLNKATAATHIFHELGTANRPNFLMVAGNDRDDEVVFRWAENLNEKGVVPETTTVSVGNRNTVAMSTLPQGTTGLLNTLNKLARL
ncbi:glycosyltransferase family 20 protein [Aaosphaeria arxii CBS 175.79]|uniref:Glycosyltransferase family 20 protein n=1 Tax=Aaosphaeria arxii CBS 175.79 TaxID=1450172 RepID=A0A6A5XN61_9PLEO|nr:glycosyltransferase family 20 protein [Aaosphaeria arxii CBS 175.79]KAF2014715.1 glycosyltransferase family 20 protein [Aaosphaeria arxii CBS 175.79]